MRPFPKLEVDKSRENSKLRVKETLRETSKIRNKERILNSKKVSIRSGKSNSPSPADTADTTNSK